MGRRTKGVERQSSTTKSRRDSLSILQRSWAKCHRNERGSRNVEKRSVQMNCIRRNNLRNYHWNLSGRVTVHYPNRRRWQRAVETSKGSTPRTHKKKDYPDVDKNLPRLQIPNRTTERWHLQVLPTAPWTTPRDGRNQAYSTGKEWSGDPPYVQDRSHSCWPICRRTARVRYRQLRS